MLPFLLKQRRMLAADLFMFKICNYSDALDLSLISFQIPQCNTLTGDYDP